MEPLIDVNCSAMECTSLLASAPIWQDILAQAMTGEVLAAMNYASLSEICDDPAEVADALEHAEVLRRRKLFPRRKGGTRESRQNLCAHRSRGRRSRRPRHGNSQSGASPGRAALRRQGLPAASGGDDHPRADAGEGMQGWTLRSVPRQLREAITFRRQAECSRASRSVAATVSEDARHAGNTRGGNTYMGDSVAGVATRARTIGVDLPLSVDFALIGHQESWRTAADVLAVLRGPERTPLPDDEIKDILPWIPPRV